MPHSSYPTSIRPSESLIVLRTIVSILSDFSFPWNMSYSLTFLTFHCSNSIKCPSYSLDLKTKSVSPFLSRVGSEVWLLWALPELVRHAEPQVPQTWTGVCVLAPCLSGKHLTWVKAWLWGWLLIPVPHWIILHLVTHLKCGVPLLPDL